MKSTLKFYWNGIKGVSGKLQRASYSIGNYTEQSGLSDETITIYSKDYSGFSAEVRSWFNVQNDSDMMTDYFEKDRVRVSPEHPLYAQVKAAMDARNSHYYKRFEKVSA